MNVYVEKDCVFEAQGMKFEAGGAIVTPDFVRGYLKANGDLTDWHGDKLGTYRITSRWKIRSYFSDEMCQVEAVVNGVKYTGRSLGVDMVFNGKRKKGR